MTELRRDELPEQLHPLFDTLTFELHRVHEYARSARKWRNANRWALGAAVGAFLVNIVQAVSVALQWAG